MRLLVVTLLVILSMEWVSSHSITFSQLADNPGQFNTGSEFEITSNTNKRGILEAQSYKLKKLDTPFASDARVHTGEGFIKAPKTHFFTGKVSSDVDSEVHLTIHESKNVTASILHEGEWYLGHRDNDVLVLKQKPKEVEPPRFKCGSHNHTIHDFEADIKKQAHDHIKRQTTECPTDFSNWQPVYAIRAAFESDYIFFQFFEDDGALAIRAAAEFIAGIIARINIFYERDLGIRISIADVFVSQTPTATPWARLTSDASSHDFLNELTFEYDDASRIEYVEQRNIGLVHLLSGRTIGGLAYVRGVCTRDFLGVSGVLKDDPKWNAVIVGHELGHSLGSPHTHCYNNQDLDCFRYGAGFPPPIDNCDGECGSNPLEKPETGGSIMSYCDTDGVGTLADIHEYMGRKGFYGTDSVRVNWAIRQHLENHILIAHPQCVTEIQPEAPSQLIEVADFCIDAITINGTGLFPWDNSRATNGQIGQDLQRCDISDERGIESDVWFRWISDDDQFITVDTCDDLSPLLDTKMAVYSTSDCGAISDTSIIDCSSNECGFKSMISFDAIKGQEYLIQLGVFPKGVSGDPIKGEGLFRISGAIRVLPDGDLPKTGFSKVWEDYKIYLIVAIVLFTLVCFCLVCVLLCLVIPKKPQEPEEINEDGTKKQPYLTFET